jgi:Phage tail tube protein
MTIAEGADVRVSYKFYAVGTIDANAQAVSSTDLVATGAQILRNTTVTPKLAKDTYASKERRSDHQIADFRHGTRHVTGALDGELSPKTYGDFFQALLRTTWTATSALGSSALTSVSAVKSTSKLHFGGGDPVALGARVGQIMVLTNVTGNASENFLILGFGGASNRDVTVFPAPADMTADSSFTVSFPGKTLIAPSTGFLKYKLGVENYDSDIALARLFTECRITAVDIKLPATGMATVEFTLMGRDQEIYSATSGLGVAPFFSSPTPETTEGLTAAVNGVIAVNGAPVGVVTSLEIKIDLGGSDSPVVGQNVVPEIFTGTVTTTGTLSAMLQDGTFLEAFADEDEVSVLVYLTTTSAPNTPAMSFYLPRIKYTDADVADSAEGALVQSLPFQALKAVTPAIGVNSTTIQIVDTEIS